MNPPKNTTSQPSTAPTASTAMTSANSTSPSPQTRTYPVVCDKVSFCIGLVIGSVFCSIIGYLVGTHKKESELRPNVIELAKKQNELEAIMKSL